MPWLAHPTSSTLVGTDTFKVLTLCRGRSISEPGGPRTPRRAAAPWPGQDALNSQTSAVPEGRQARPQKRSPGSCIPEPFPDHLKWFLPSFSFVETRPFSCTHICVPCCSINSVKERTESFLHLHTTTLLGHCSCVDHLGLGKALSLPLR